MIRPTSDKVREAVFNVLGVGFPFQRALDLFAGTGAMGIEALSRGATEAVFVDSDARAAALIRKNLEKCGLGDAAAKVLKKDVLGSIEFLKRRGESFDLVFIDAPYAESASGEAALAKLAETGIIDSGGGGGGGAVVVYETSAKAPALDTDAIARLELDKRKRYGDTVVYFFKTV